MSFTQHFIKCVHEFYSTLYIAKCEHEFYSTLYKVCTWVLLNTLLQFHKFFLTVCIFVVFNNVNTVRSEMWVWGFPNHSCQKFFTNHSSSTRDLTRFLAFVIWKTPYSHFLLTVLSHCTKQPNRFQYPLINNLTQTQGGASAVISGSVISREISNIAEISSNNKATGALADILDLDFGAVQNNEVNQQLNRQYILDPQNQPTVRIFLTARLFMWSKKYGQKLFISQIWLRVL